MTTSFGNGDLIQLLQLCGDRVNGTRKLVGFKVYLPATFPSQRGKGYG